MKSTRNRRRAGQPAPLVSNVPAHVPGTPYVMPINRTPLFRYVVGVDPDKNESGLAVWSHDEGRFIHYDKHRLLDLLKRVKPLPTSETIVFVEAGWLNEGMYEQHKEGLPDGFADWSAAGREGYMWRIGATTGTNFGIGHAIVQLLRDMGFRVEEYQPTTGKWSADDLTQFTGIVKRMNQDVRDAIRAAFQNK